MSTGVETDRRFAVAFGRHQLEGEVAAPGGATGLVIFAHGSGSSRFSPRNLRVARRLQAHGLATLLFDLLSDEEARHRSHVFDIPLLTGRLMEAISFALAHADLARLPIGLFGASTGAAAALVAAARAPGEVAAVVSRGGRPDLAGEALQRVRAATLLIVGGADYGVIGLNEEAYQLLGCEKRLEIVPGATHLFEEPGALERVAELAGHWFKTHLGARPS
jgi:pimeloyl-ACP methyl ester carboxylesterase